MVKKPLTALTSSPRLTCVNASTSSPAPRPPPLRPLHCRRNSLDGTSDILSALRPFLEALDIPYFNTSTIDPSQGSRIPKLAQLRNLALSPLYEHKVPVTASTTVLFANDVAACPDDLLELILQRRLLAADMTCATD